MWVFPLPCFFQCFFFLLEAGFCVLLILLECSSYHHLEEFITLSPSLLPRPVRLRNKSSIVWGAALSSGALASSYSAPDIPYNQKARGEINPASLSKGVREKGLREQRLRPPAIKSSSSKAKDLRKERKEQVHKSVCSYVCTSPEQLINTEGKTS